MTKNVCGAVLLVIALILAPFSLIASVFLLAVAGALNFPKTLPGLIGTEAGVVAVTYYVRGGGLNIVSTTPPTAIQANQVFKQTALISMADADTQALFTHNWGLDASAPQFFEPEILEYALLTTTGGTYQSGLTFDVTNTNVVKVNKLNFLGTGGSFIVSVRRPHSLGQ